MNWFPVLGESRYSDDNVSFGEAHRFIRVHQAQRTGNNDWTFCTLHCLLYFLYTPSRPTLYRSCEIRIFTLFYSDIEKYVF